MHMKNILHYKHYIAAAIVAVLTFICYRYTLHNQFTCWDDDYYVTNDPYIKGLTFDNLKVIFTKDITKNNYHPFCMLSLAINYAFTGLNPMTYYLTNILIHIANALLVYLLALTLCSRLKMTEEAGFFMAACTSLWFGIHPMHVESVSWIAERKDVLYAFFYLWGMLTYLKYTETEQKKWYLATTVLFIASCLSKPMAVVFPLSLICIDFLLQRRWDASVITDKVLFFLISLICGGGAYYTQNATGAIADFNKLTIAERVMYASYGFDMYISKFFNPTYLSTFYPYPYRYIDGYLPGIYYAAPAIAVLLPTVVIALLYRTQRKNTLRDKKPAKGTAILPKQEAAKPIAAEGAVGKTLPFNPANYGLDLRMGIFAFAFLFANLVFVLQFISCGAAIMADRYSYVAYTGWTFAVVYFLYRLLQRLPDFKFIVYGFLVLVTGFFGWLCQDRTNAWHDSETLLSDAIEKYPMRALLSYKWLGNYYLSIGELDKALDNYGVLTMLHAADAKICDNVGNIYVQKKEYRKAVDAFTMSMGYQNNVYKTYADRALAYSLIGDSAAAARDFEMAAQLNPAIAGAMPQGATREANGVPPAMPVAGGIPIKGGKSGHFDSCVMQIRSGDTLRAFRNFILSYKENPGTEKRLAEMGFSWVQNKQYVPAINLYGVLVKLNSSNGFYYFYRGVAKFSLGNTDAAIGDWLTAMTSKTKDVQQSASYNLCVAYDGKGNDSLAVYYADVAKGLGYNVTPEYYAKLKEKKAAQHKR